VQVSPPAATQSMHTEPPEPQVDSARGWQSPIALSQQPVGHEVPSHTHIPPEQRWPGLHALPPGPQLQNPLAQRSLSVVEQLVSQVPPGLPHAAGQPGIVQMVPAQHAWPVHDCASQMHCPPEQRCPDPHAPPVAPHLHEPPWQVSPLAESHCAPPPQRQVPLPQLSVSEGSQKMHAPAPVPQFCGVGGLKHAPALQQPPPQPLESHTQPAAVQCSPGAHALPSMLHWQLPEPEQLLATTRSQAMQVPPLEPHEVTERGMHWPPAQQLLGHEVASHTQPLAVQRCPGWQAAPAPHAQPPVDEH
jgi:hypothetical protein